MPTTWDELIAACETLEAAGITPIYSTFKEPWTVAQGLFDYTVGGSIDVADFYDEMNELGTEVGPDSTSRSRRRFMTRSTGCWSSPPTRTTTPPSRGYGDGNAAFAKGEAAMSCRGRGHSARSRRPIPTSSSAPSRCR